MNYDQEDVNRARTWDLIGPDGPSEDIHVLMGALGVFGAPLAQQRDALRAWLISPAAIPAPEKLRTAVLVFLPMADQRAVWQEKLDKQFPKGAIAAWTSGNIVSYRIAFIFVEGMAGLDPVLSLYAWPDRVLDGMQVSSWGEPDEDGLVQVTFATEKDGMSFSAAVPDALARDMAKDRAELRENLLPPVPAE